MFRPAWDTSHHAEKECDVQIDERKDLSERRKREKRRGREDERKAGEKRERLKKWRDRGKRKEREIGERKMTENDLKQNSQETRACGRLLPRKKPKV